MFKKILIDPVELEYVQFTDENKDRVYNDLTDIQHNIWHAFDQNKQPILRIPTLEGELICHLGDYIIKYPNPKDWCKFMCCSADVFESLMKAFGQEL